MLTLSEKQTRLIGRWAPVLGLFLGFGFLYARTLLPGIHHFGDVTKAQFLAKTLGTTHPTGYPLYVALTAPFAALPWGTLALRINAFSALCAVVALLLVYATCRELGVNRLLSTVSACCLGLSRMFWDQAVIAEVYALNVSLVALVVYLLVRFVTTKRVKWFLWAAAAYSLSFGNHLTMITLLPAFTMAIALNRFGVLRNGKVVLATAAFILIGALQYYYLFWRTEERALYLEYEIKTLGELGEYVSGERYKSLMFAFSPSQLLLERTPRFARQVFQDIGWLSFFALPGLWPRRTSAGRRDEAHMMCLAVVGLSAVGQFVWTASYDIFDIEIYLIPFEMLLTLLIAMGLQTTSDALSVRARPAFALATFVPLVPLFANGAPDHRKSASFEATIKKQLETAGDSAVIVNRIHYSPRMAYIYFLYATDELELRDQHLDYSAGPKDVSKYLRRLGSLRDSHTRQSLAPGRRVIVDSRGASAANWRREGLKLRPIGHGLSEATISKRPRPNTSSVDPAK